jgi:hypothetical protein
VVGRRKSERESRGESFNTSRWRGNGFNMAFLLEM